MASRQAGLSLVELMVGLAIGLMLTLGLFAMIGTQSTTFKVQDDFARMQENATLALRYIGDSIRMAGFYGHLGNQEDDALVNAGVNTVTDCGSATNAPSANWALAFTAPISGAADRTPANVNAMYPCISAANFVTGPILVTRGSSGIPVRDTAPLGDLSADLAALPNYATTIYVQSEPSRGTIFYGNSYAANKVAAPELIRLTRTLTEASIFEYRAHVYYLRPCSRQATPGTCAATDDDGRPIPTLVRQELVGSNMVEVPLVEGVERIDIRYGIDDLPSPNPGPIYTGVGDGVPDRYVAAPTAAEWTNVVTVKVTVLVRATTLIAGYDDSAKTYDLDGDNVADFTCTAGVNCMFRRKVFSQTFQLRNRAQVRGA